MAYFGKTRRILNMVWSNIDMPPRKRVRGVTINERGSNPPKRGNQEPPTGGLNRGKRLISERVIIGSQATLSEPEDDQPLQSRRDEILARSHLDIVRAPPALKSADLVPAPTLNISDF
ncbi:hypothetical protein H5410_036117 [Solanum commersonii]|uniref:Uncharacterized protein n=1 Tax=Solanum commersonii TaxID=4109 RepID=A0A9J5Y3U4_SOLCO|nr:hypothetical protein H5410_036117 [Solanum commersonii]